MLGMKERSSAPLINVPLEALVPQDHYYRHLERTLDLSFVRKFVQQTYASGGRPSIDPVVFFDAIVEQCQQVGLVWGRELYLDGTQVNANADLDSLTPRFAVEAREAMQAHLAALFPDGDHQQEQQEAAGDSADMPIAEATSTAVIACSVPTPLPVILAEPEREELALENAARHDWIAEQGSLSGMFTAPTSARLISASARLILMRPPCA